MADFADRISEHAAELTDLDRQIGDADHGSNMERGMKAVAALAADDFPDAASYLKKAGMTLVSTVGGASGPLYGTFLLRFAAAAPADESPAAMAAAWRAGLDGVIARGKAGLGDKTMVDALQPAVEAMESSHPDLASCLAAGLQAAAAGREAAVPLVARKGRASYLGERSAGHADPGATSMTMLLESAAATLR
ncbi:dihydroxyacetone kinase subunit DhaL [Luteococcus peritonei]|uniref:Dihydroxyacetone kinase subunit DhaL n=1 Tax=Luteococcus peritonei TaxID=88874 RepID=A0ABW4RWS3_9ACTN